jgi:hypothetical protein
MLPKLGLIDQTSDWFDEFCTAAEKICDCPPDNVTPAGVSETEGGGDKLIVALADPVGVATLVAVKVTACAEAMTCGAV